MAALARGQPELEKEPSQPTAQGEVAMAALLCWLTLAGNAQAAPFIFPTDSLGAGEAAALLGPRRGGAPVAAPLQREHLEG